MIAEGSQAPDFAIEGEGGQQVRLADFKGAKLVLYFYPKDDTSGCTREAIDFTALIDDFGKADTVVLGVSKDSAKSHEKFAGKHALKVRLGSDPEGKARSEEHTSELQSLMRISYAVFCLKKKKNTT